MRRRDFITGIVGSTAAWPLAAHAQQNERMRRVGVLIGGGETDPEFRAALTVFAQVLQQSGWTDGRNVRIEYRWGGGSVDAIRKHAAELSSAAPDAILVSGTAAVGPMIQATRTVPIVFVNVPDPVGAGFVNSLARPGGNATGFANFEYGLSGKWLELLKEMSPPLTRAAVLRDAAIPAGAGQFDVIKAAAQSLGMEVSPIDVRDAPEIERAVATYARSPNGGLIVTQSALALVHRNLILALEARHKLPAVHSNRLWVAAGGLMSYGANLADEFRRGAGYVDRVLKGAKPADLPVQMPTRYELAINLKTAKAIGLTVPPTLLARADQVIELDR